VVEQVADRVIVMQDGQHRRARQLATTPFSTTPQQDYTRKLLSAIPAHGRRPIPGRRAAASWRFDDAEAAAGAVNPIPPIQPLPA
jgi:ABC-type microcin C transport system duplicated ATPase subunit YejF